MTAADETGLAWEGVEYTLSGVRHVSVLSLGTAPIPEGSQPVARVERSDTPGLTDPSQESRSRRDRSP